jgi:predicted ABC-type ATPase
MRPPRFWLIAGPNGSGKSTFVGSAWLQKIDPTPEEAHPLLVINPDEIFQQLVVSGVPLDMAQIEAAQMADERLRESIEIKRSVLRETVLSTNRLRPVVERALAQGFQFNLVFVYLKSPDLNVARVRRRVARGGHDVDEAKVRARWFSAFEQLPWFSLARPISRFLKTA